MDPKLFISLLTPLLALALSAAFCVLWLFRRNTIYVAQLAIAFLLVSGAFLLQSFELGLGYALSRFVSNLWFLGAIMLLVSAVLRRRDLAVPLGTLSLITGITMLLTGWYSWGQEDFYMRVLIVNFGLGALALTGAIRLLRAGRPTGLDRPILVVMALGIVYFFARPLVELLLADSSPQMPDITSPYWLATSLTSILYCLLVALTMLTAAALDAMAELQAQTQTDPLSGLLNRRGFEAHGAKLLEAYATSGLPLCLVMADLDHFKTVNDQYGHARGDQAIADFARRLQSSMGAEAIAGRLGGEEFAVLLPLTELTGALLFAEAVRAAGQQADGIRVTASFGVAERQTHEKLEHLLERCDTALYAAKRDGRDCVRVAEARPTRRQQFLRNSG